MNHTNDESGRLRNAALLLDAACTGSPWHVERLWIVTAETGRILFRFGGGEQMKLGLQLALSHEEATVSKCLLLLSAPSAQTGQIRFSH